MQFRQTKKAYQDALELWNDATGALYRIQSQTIEAVEDGRLPVTLMRAYAEAHAHVAVCSEAFETARHAWNTAHEEALNAAIAKERDALDAAEVARDKSFAAVNAIYDEERANAALVTEARKALLAAARTDPEGAEPLAEAYRQRLAEGPRLRAALVCVRALADQASHEHEAAARAFHTASAAAQHRFDKETL